MKDSALIVVQTVRKDWSWEILGFLDLLENLKKLNPDFTLATVKADVLLTNDGKDYTSYVRFDNVFKVQGIEVLRVPERIDRINVGESLSKHYEYKFTAQQAPEAAWKYIQEQTLNWSFDVQNLSYEKFS